MCYNAGKQETSSPENVATQLIYEAISGLLTCPLQNVLWYQRRLDVESPGTIALRQI